MKTHFYNEIELYETKTDKVAIFVTLLIIASVIAIIWQPDVEAIGTLIHSFLK